MLTRSTEVKALLKSTHLSNQCRMSLNLQVLEVIHCLKELEVYTYEANEGSHAVF